MNENGTLSYLEEHDFHHLIDYYEDEFLLNKALEAANHAISQHPFCADFLLVKARLLLHHDRPYRAMRFLDRAEVIAPLEVEVYLLRAKAFSALGDYDQALTLLDQAKKFSTGSDLLDLYLCESAICEGMKDFERMFESLARALQLDPSSEEALDRIWISVELSKKYHESILVHERVLDVDAYTYQAWFNLGHAYACLGEYRKAIEAIEFSFLINPEFELGYLDCAELCSQEQDFAKALEIYRELVQRFGADCEDLVKMAECEFEMGLYEESRRTLVEAMQLDQYNDEVFYFLGKCFRAERRYGNAISALIKAIELEDRREEYYSELAQAYVCLEEYGKADFYFAKACEISPEQECYWLDHTRFLMRIQKYERALHVIEEADYHTFSAELLYCKATCLLKLDLRKKALRIMDEALVEQFNLHKILFEIYPEIHADREICSMVRYYQGERVNSLH